MVQPLPLSKRKYLANYLGRAQGKVGRLKLIELAKQYPDKRLSGASLLILANKQDLKGALTPDEIAKVLNLENMDKTRHWKIVGCSAYIGEGLLEGFDWLVQDMMIP
uniref:ADP-ribosylation factor n=1 Tax=Manihot esculenta TaxID=3983 RepID=A0A2C9UMJ7_MANES